jgi:hypothetical protein
MFGTVWELYSSFTIFVQFSFAPDAWKPLLSEPLASASVVKIPPSLRRDSVHMSRIQDGRRHTPTYRETLGWSRHGEATASYRADCGSGGSPMTAWCI